MSDEPLQHIGGDWECWVDTAEIDAFRGVVGSWPFQICTTAASYWWCASKDWLDYHDTLAYAERGREPS